VHIEYDPEADAAYVSLTDTELATGRDTFPAEGPEGVPGEVLTDWKDGKLVGIEILGARALLHEDLLAQATPPGEKPRKSLTQPFGDSDISASTQ
jgi:uncharacterized protein YuzE